MATNQTKRYCSRCQCHQFVRKESFTLGRDTQAEKRDTRLVCMRCGQGTNPTPEEIRQHCEEIRAGKYLPSAKYRPEDVVDPVEIKCTSLAPIDEPWPEQ